MTDRKQPFTIGILGGGQLARMLALAGYTLGLRFLCLDPARYSPAGDVADLLVGDFSDEAALSAFAARVDVVTYEFENVPIECVERLAQDVAVHPHPVALRTSQDRLTEKQCFIRAGLPVHPFEAPHSRADFLGAIGRLGLPCVVKTRRLGYDGKGQAVVRSVSDAEQVWQELGNAPLLVEAFVPFKGECSLIAARSVAGDVRFYPWTANVHVGGILRSSRAPLAGVPQEWLRRAEATAASLLEEFKYVGVLAIEFFITDQGLLANEMAPRVHNSGHWTMDAGITSQFENHVRAVAGLALGATAMSGCAGMVNLIGHAPAAAVVLAASDRHRLHLYGKEPKPGRKLGHINMRADTPAGLDSLLDACEAAVLNPSSEGIKPAPPRA